MTGSARVPVCQIPPLWQWVMVTLLLTFTGPFGAGRPVMVWVVSAATTDSPSVNAIVISTSRQAGRIDVLRCSGTVIT